MKHFHSKGSWRCGEARLQELLAHAAGYVWKVQRPRMTKSFITPFLGLQGVHGWVKALPAVRFDTAEHMLAFALRSGHHRHAVILSGVKLTGFHDQVYPHLLSALHRAIEKKAEIGDAVRRTEGRNMCAQCKCPHRVFIESSPLGLDGRPLRPSSIAETKDPRTGLMNTQAADGYTRMQGAPRTFWWEPRGRGPRLYKDMRDRVCVAHDLGGVAGMRGKRSPSVARLHTHQSVPDRPSIG